MLRLRPFTPAELFHVCREWPAAYDKPFDAGMVAAGPDLDRATHIPQSSSRWNNIADQVNRRLIRGDALTPAQLRHMADISCTSLKSLISVTDDQARGFYDAWLEERADDGTLDAIWSARAAFLTAVGNERLFQIQQDQDQANGMTPLDPPDMDTTGTPMCHGAQEFAP